MKPDQKEITILRRQPDRAPEQPPPGAAQREGPRSPPHDGPHRRMVIRDLQVFEKKTFRSAEKGDLDLEKWTTRKRGIRRPLRFHQDAPGGEDQGGQALHPPEDSVACLSGEAYDMSAYLEKILKASGQDVPKTKRVLDST